jgi:metal-responsive CopG/Arc/MetJ family transcriptional regulator
MSIDIPVRVTVTLPQRLLGRVDSRRNGLSRSAIVRALLDKGLKQGQEREHMIEVRRRVCIP